MILPHIYTFAGRKQNKPNERNDCTVRALAISTNTDYNTAHDFLKSVVVGVENRFYFLRSVLMIVH